jgi:hypothetical protein
MKKIYIIGHETAFKIGFSEHPEQRLKEIQTGNENQLEILFEMERKDACQLEKHLHRKFGKSRKMGEWFDRDTVTVQQVIVAAYNYTEHDWG